MRITCRLALRFTPFFVGAGGEVDRIVEPDRNERRYMGATVGSNRRDPEEVGVLKRTPRLLPSGRDRVQVAKTWVELGLGTCQFHGTGVVETGDIAIRGSVSAIPIRIVCAGAAGERPPLLWPERFEHGGSDFTEDVSSSKPQLVQRYCRPRHHFHWCGISHNPRLPNASGGKRA